jgi:hypothetical protein
MQRDIEREEARNPEASRWTVDQSWLHPDEAERRDDGDSREKPS